MLFTRKICCTIVVNTQHTSYSSFPKSCKWILSLLLCHIRQLKLRKLAKVRASRKHSQDLSSSDLHPGSVLVFVQAHCGMGKLNRLLQNFILPYLFMIPHSRVKEQSGITKNDLALSNRGKQIKEHVR